jgi:hypothetical protein
MKLNECEPGMYVTYVPHHAKGNAGHPDCERGTISSKNDTYVFVRFGRSTTGQACDPSQLVRG